MIHPRRLKGKPRNIGRYFTIGDYYSKGPDEQSEWGGRIAADLGLSGKVDPSIFEQLLSGQVGEQQLGRLRAGGEIEHHPGWDFAVNAPKSVSIMALVGGDDRIFRAHEQAVSTALDYLEEHASLRRRSAQGVVYETTGRLLLARFTEHASRELDPHLHTHVVVLNMTNGSPEDRMASLETRAMYAEQMTAGQIYRNELAHRLRELGYDIVGDPRRGLFEIEGVSADLIAEMSTRSRQINAHAREHGLSGQAAKRISFYETRRPKERASIVTLRERWQLRLGRHAEKIEEVRQAAIEGDSRKVAADPTTVARAALFGIREADSREAVNNRGQFLRRALASHVSEVRLQDVEPLIIEHENRRKLLATHEATGDKTHIRGRATRKTVRLEIAISDHLSLALHDGTPLSSADQLHAVARAAGLNEPQSVALVDLGTSEHRVIGLHGVAGSGKSTLIRALREAVGDQANLIALAPTSSAASNLGASAGIASRTVASLIAGGGRDLDERDVLILDEAGQLGNRQAIRVLEISRSTGARLILLGDNRQTGAIEQGKPFWLMQRLGLPKAELTESVRQETRSMKNAVTQARLGNYGASLAALDRVVDGAATERLAEQLVEEWARLKPASRAGTNILVLDNTTRHIVNQAVRETLRAEGAIAAEEARLSILVPAGLSAQEKQFARFYSGGQVVTFARGNADLGLVKGAEYRILGLSRESGGRQIVRLADEQGMVIRWDPRLGHASQVNVFAVDQRDLAAGDRIQWRLVAHELGIRNADRGTVLGLDGSLATIRWDRDARVQDVDLSRHKSWDHGYAETIYSAQSKTYDRAYVLAPSASPLVTGQTYYTAVTRARFGVKLWTESVDRLVERLEGHSGEKSSALEGRGALDRSAMRQRSARHRPRLEELREEQLRLREERRAAKAFEASASRSVPSLLAVRAQQAARQIDSWLSRLIAQARNVAHDRPIEQPQREARHER